MKFRIAIKHSDKAVKTAIELMEDYNIKVYNLREAEMVDNKDGSKMGEVYLLCCESSAWEYLKIKKEHFNTVIKHEGFRTLM